MTLSPLHLYLVCGESIHLIFSVSLSSPPVSGVWWEYTLDCLCLSLLSTCSCCVVSAYTWLSLCLSLSLLSTCSCCVVSAYTWLSLSLSLSSPPVAGVWWAHTLDWLYDSLSLLSTCSWCGVSAYTWLALWLSLSPLHLYLVCGERIHLIGSMSLSILHL